jgi:hypothetical protein
MKEGNDLLLTKAKSCKIDLRNFLSPIREDDWAPKQNFTSHSATFLPEHRLSNTVNAGTYHEDCYPNCN